MLLDSVRPVHFSKGVIEIERKQDEKWDGEGCSDTCDAGEKFNYKSIKQYLLLAEIHLDIDSWSWLQVFGGGHGFMLVSQISL